MQKITRTELAWLVGELDRAAANARNLAALADKLNKTAEKGDKRIEVLS